MQQLASQEVGAAGRLAKQTGNHFFDAISAYDDFHSGEVIKSLSTESERKLYAAQIVVHFAGHGSMDAIIALLVRGPYDTLVAQGSLREVPTLQASSALKTQAPNLRTTPRS